MNGIVIGGARSGVGKTVATLSVIRALENAGRAVQPAKAGPDFIDPSHHERVAGRPSRTLDLWMQGEDGLRRNYHRGEGDVCVVEGVMGLYDGDVSSTAAVAEALSLPVVLVVNASAGMESVAATALGFREYADRIGLEIDVAGIIAQRAHGGRHERGIREALPEEMAYFGRIPPQEDLEIPDRHLGLHMGEESPLPQSALDAAADHLEADRLLETAREPPRPDTASPVSSRPSGDGPSVAVARDAAFRFVYPATIERLREAGVLVTFQPVAGDDVPDCDGVYLPGGYPELHAEALSGSPAVDQLADRAADGLPIFGECGGLMALSETLTTAEGTEHDMAGILPAAVRMHDRYRALDHVQLRARTGTLTAAPGERLRGHEFHYSSADVAGDASFAFEVERGDGIADGLDGLTEHRTLGTYAHVHPESGAFDSFLDRL
ncbi:Cobyrinic acid a,c-diamide synthase [Halalkaliarchaeum sp. AArc-CO]|uniref:cobyrinic acid a,c-diamide synthase n=1 Tax=unclassified Halalkaliarchaeum TaxID=2678344 RepID=UPI00217D5907|nr:MULTISPECIES: cobyrinic acid a,c-diamide synthase [unclassified Halalkaliarchaeum]MDR5673152.1 cobyrinic acid a,c-diamide synthase [Halalkaliarchaeum sp. AArc-GB]UWG49615.1 Cobyrinic acid a,c-diamide synthase [Halalkaliarchaeum sp. AArc-CO]